MSKAMAALDRLADTIGGCTCSMCATNREDASALRDYITTTEARMNAVPAQSGKTKAEERDDILIHMQMLCTDDMRADACADATEHDLPFQVFRILGGYDGALDRLTKSAARIKELEEALAKKDAALDVAYPAMKTRRTMISEPAQRILCKVMNAEDAQVEAALSGARKVNSLGSVRGDEHLGAMLPDEAIFDARKVEQ